jgi:acetone carboxylase gamma subunit
MQFQCKACGSSFSAMEWNIATRKNISKNKDFIPIQKIHDDPDAPNINVLKWFCPNCSIDKPDVKVKFDEY